MQIISKTSVIDFTVQQECSACGGMHLASCRLDASTFTEASALALAWQRLQTDGWTSFFGSRIRFCKVCSEVEVEIHIHESA